jgi:hypothetical protein
VLNINSRDFLEKYFNFSDNGKYYIYFSHVPNDKDIRAVPPKTDRAFTLLGVETLERRDDGKIVFTMLVQCDFKMQITPKIVQMFLPKGIQAWTKAMNKYISENYNSI